MKFHDLSIKFRDYGLGLTAALRSLPDLASTSFRIGEMVEEILLVNETDIEFAIATLVENQKIVAEGAGAAGVAALMAHGERFKGQKVATVICGGNIDVRLLSGVLNRQLVRDGRMVRLRIDIIDRPGVLAKLTEVIGRTSGNIIEVQHQRLFYDVPVKQAEIDIIVETRNASHVQEIVDALKAAGFSSRVLSNRALDANS